MSIRDNNLKDGQDENKDPIVELIYESINLMEDNIRLLLENRKLRERVKLLESFNRVFFTKPLGKSSSECAFMVVKNSVEA